jgi:hypothetical protein
VSLYDLWMWWIHAPLWVSLSAAAAVAEAVLISQGFARQGSIVPTPSLQVDSHLPRHCDDSSRSRVVNLKHLEACLVFLVPGTYGILRPLAATQRHFGAPHARFEP